LWKLIRKKSLSEYLSAYRQRYGYGKDWNLKFALQAATMQQNVIIKLSKFLLEMIQPQIKADGDLKLKLRCHAKLLPN